MSVTWRIMEGDCRDMLRSLPAGSVHTCVTSPPYFGLRDYGTEGQIGLEPTPDEFVAALVAVFREVRRVLRDDGTVWLNLGDSYATQASGNPQRYFNGQGWAGDRGGAASARRGDGSRRDRVPEGWKPKDLLGIPWIVAFALRADGWYLRSDIIWSKPNPMPESVTDRPTKAHEYVFLLSKGPRYFYDADAIREPHTDSNGSRDAAQRLHGTTVSGERVAGAALDDSPYRGQQKDRGLPGVGTTFAGWDPAGRNKRSVWTVATQPYAGAHFATFPPKLIEPCILAGAPERACGECGAPWVRVVERTSVRDKSALLVGGKMEALRDSGARKDGLSTSNSHNGACTPDIITLGFEPSCSHGDGTASGVVLDPFAGAGTTGMVALRHNRSFIGVELNPVYAAMARRRIVDDAPLMNQVSEAAA